MAGKAEKNYVKAIVLLHLGRLDRFIKLAATHRSEETVHQIRIHSRRLRTSLAIFKSIFPKKKIKRWLNNLRRLQKGFGPLRDTDVQISFLHESLKSLRRKSDRDRLESLMRRQKEKRIDMAKRAVRSVRSFQRSQTSSALRNELKQMEQRPVSELNKKLKKIGCRMVKKELKEMDSLKKYVKNPAQVDQLHQLRLAIKRLRYSLEGFDIIYGGKLKRFIEPCKRMQTDLGNMHDYNIWLHDKRVKFLYRQLKFLQKESYNRFRKEWSKQKKKNRWQKLLKDLN